MKRILGLLVIMLFGAAKVLAAGEPPEVILYAAEHAPAYDIEDYCSFRETPTVDYGFALLRSKEDRKLAIFCGAPGRKLEIWQTVSGAVPQNPNAAYFQVPEAGETLIDPIDGSETVCDGLRFSVCVEDDDGESVLESVTYQFEKTGFYLHSYRFAAVSHCFIREGALVFYSSATGHEGTVEGTLEREITRVEFGKLPKSVEEAKERVFSDDMPISAARLVTWYFPDYSIVDYRPMEAGGDTYGLTLLSQEHEHMLVFCRILEGGGDADLLYATKKAVPQGAGSVFFCGEGETEEFSLALAASREETSLQSGITVVWEADAFRLKEYFDAEAGERVTRVNDETLAFGQKTAQVSMLSDIRYIDFDALPKTLEEAKANPSIVPAIPMVAHPYRKALTAKVKPMIEGRNHKVYVGPGERYPRSGAGKGTVSTNGWVQVFGAENGWLMIQYHIDGNRYRIGYIEEPVLRRGVKVDRLEFEHDQQEVTERCILTDDPMGSAAPLLTLEPGTPVRKLIWLGERWEYVEVEMDGILYRGFVPTECLTHG